MMCLPGYPGRLPRKRGGRFRCFHRSRNHESAPFVQKLIPQTWPDYEQHKDAIIRRRSVKYWAEKLNVPLLIMNGTADQQVTLSSPLAWRCSCTNFISTTR